MSRKIYDIIPSEKIEKKESFHDKKKPKKRLDLFLLFPALVVFSLLGVIFLVQGKAEVRIYPNIEEASLTATIMVNTAEAIVDFENLVLPGVIFSDTKEFSGDYSSTGTDSKTKKATGIIRVYNKVSPAKSQSLVKNTRFLSVPGELTYKADEAFVIPANGHVDIAVTAEKAGTEYNISSATFSVPGLSGTSIFTSIYAETISPLGGGEDSQIKIVTTSDITSSKESFKEKYGEIAKKELIDSIPESFMYVPDNISLEFKDLSVNALAGAEVDKFNAFGKVSSSVVAFRKDEIIKIGEKLIIKDIPEIRKIVPNSIICQIENFEVVEGKIKLGVVFTAKTYSLPEEELLRGALLNNKEANAASLLENMLEIDKVEIDIFPFWRSSLPAKEDSVEIKLRFN